MFMVHLRIYYIPFENAKTPPRGRGFSEKIVHQLFLGSDLTGTTDEFRTLLKIDERALFRKLPPAGMPVVSQQYL
jgi:hypothetical protein